MTTEGTVIIIPDTITQAKMAFHSHNTSKGLKESTIDLYERNITTLTDYFHTRHIFHMKDITSASLEAFFNRLRPEHNQGGIHGYFRSIKVFLKWYWFNYDIEAKNPIDKVKIKPASSAPRKGISMEHFALLLDACKTNYATRDKAILMCLLDSCARATEFASLNVSDVDLVTGQVLIRQGKGDKQRVVRFGERALKMLRRYLKSRGSNIIKTEPLFLTDQKGRFDRFSLRLLVDRRADDAKIPHYGLHDFRRRGARELLKNGMDIKTISKYLGHSSVLVTERYLRVEDEEILASHKVASPVDNANL